MLPTPHHLELFYYVARFGGICAATRAIPYGIGQPAVSGQMKELEETVGRRLFERRPFRLTEAGQEIYAHIAPMFDGWPKLLERLQAGPVPRVCLAVSGPVGPEFLAAVVAAAGFAPEAAGLEVRTGLTGSPAEWLARGMADVVIAVTERRIPGGRAQVLARPGLRLLVGSRSDLAAPAGLWRTGRLPLPLICPAEDGAVQRVFAAGLRGLRVGWPGVLRVESPEATRALVAAGLGLAVEPDLPAGPPPRGVRVLPLPGFGSVWVTLQWRPGGPLTGRLAEAVRAVAQEQWGKTPSTR